MLGRYYWVYYWVKKYAIKQKKRPNYGAFC